MMGVTPRVSRIAGAHGVEPGGIPACLENQLTQAILCILVFRALCHLAVWNALSAFLSFCPSIRLKPIHLFPFGFGVRVHRNYLYLLPSLY